MLMRAATVVQVLQDLFYVLLHVYFTCDRSFSAGLRRQSGELSVINVGRVSVVVRRRVAIGRL